MADVMPVVLVGTGLLLLLGSLLPIHTLRKQSSSRTLAWRVVLVLTLFFIAGYSVYGVLVVTNQANLNNLLVSLILFTGSIFVLLVSRISVSAMLKEKEIARTERYRALHDELTDLPNRTLLYETIEQHIKLAKRNAEQLTVLLMDLNEFKNINDTLGHHWGDELLRQLAPRLLATVRSSDTVARLGGDEFAIVLPTSGVDEAISLAEKINQVIEKPFDLDEHDVSLSSSIGIAVYPLHGFDSETLLQRADVAMYNAKHAAATYSVYDIKQDKNSIDQLTIGHELREAIQADQLLLYYQPKIDLARKSVCALEALVRWEHPEHGMILPDQFVSMAEKAGLINPLTEWVLNAALKQLQEWNGLGIGIPVAINISLRNLQNRDFPARVNALLSRWQINPGRITFEITESSMMLDPDLARKVMDELDDMGIHFSIDDFGTGYSSLAYLKRLPAKEIKIDKSFVMDMTEDENDAVIVRSTIDMAHNMGRHVTAEGVATRDIHDVLEILRCDMGQGNYFCCALPPDEFIRWLADTSWGVTNQTALKNHCETLRRRDRPEKHKAAREQ